jgi:hypothetical protein
MKSIIFFLILILCGAESMHAQIHISANLSHYGKFNYKTNLYDSSFKDNQVFSSFEFDRDFTILTHKADSKTSTYLIRSKKKDEVNNRWEFDIISDAGYSYYMIIDIPNENMRFIYRVKGFAYVTQFYIKNIRVDKQDTNN